MKKLIIIPLILITLLVNATNWYVSPTGNDAAAGSFAAPWKTWGFAFNTTNIQPGDCVLFRGGVYDKNMNDGLAWYYYPNRNQSSVDGGTGYAITRDGTAENWIIYSAYMPDFHAGNKPILNGRNAGTSAYNVLNRFNFGIRATDVNYVKFYGLTVQGIVQNPLFPGDASGYNGSVSYGWRITGNPIIIENCVIHDIHGIGLETNGATAPAFNYIINTDVYNCCDSVTLTLPGNDGYGFDHSYGGQLKYMNCRAWLCGDYGFWAWTSASSHASQYTVYDGCWGFRNGMMGGSGQGFCSGWIAYTDGNIKRTYTNCIAAYNRGNGWFTYDYKSTYPHAVYMNVYNSVGFHNGYQGVLGSPYGYMGFITSTYDTYENEYKRVFKNCIAYGNENGNYPYVWTGLNGDNGLYTHEYNTWDIPLTLSAADFISLDSTGISGPRQADGSLPDLSGFLHPAEGASFIGAGIGVGLVYDGDGNLWSQTTPSLGAYEYDAPEPPEPPDYPEVSGVTPTKTSATSVTTGGTAIDDGTGTISMKGVCWSTSINPTITDSRTWDGSGTDDYTSTITGLKLNTTYYVRSYITNETGTTYGESYQVVTPAVSVMKGTKVFVKSGKILVID